MQHTAMDLKRHFEPITTKEFLDFWKGLTPEEQEEWKNADLS